MADETKILEVKVVGETDDYTRKMTAAANATSRVEAAAGGASEKADKLGKKGKDAAKEFDRMKVAGEGLKRTLQGVGGKLGESGEKVTALSEGLGKLVTVMGRGGVAAGLFVASLVAVGIAGLGAAAKTGELLKELDELKRTPVISKEQRDDVAEADLALKELGASTKEVVVLFGAQFAPALTTVAQGLDLVVDGTGKLAGNIQNIVSLGLYDSFIRPQLESWGVIEGDIEGARKELDKLKQTYNDLEELTHGGQISASRRETPVSSLEAQQSAVRSLLATARQLNVSRLEGEEAVIARYEDTLALIEEQAKAAGNASGAVEAANDARLAAMEALEAGLAEVAEERERRERKEAEREEKAREKKEKAEQRATDRRKREREREFREALALIEAEQQARQHAAETTLDNARNVTSSILQLAQQSNQEHRTLAKIAFGVDKSAAILKNTIYGANAFTAALDDAPVPFNFVLAASVAGAAAAQTAVIAAQQPSFHIGTRSTYEGDEAMWRVTRREVPAVLTPQGRQTVGDLAADANAARQTASEQVVIAVLGHEALDRVTARAARNPNSALHHAILQGEPNGHSRGRR